jgi:hypothetical protein
MVHGGVNVLLFESVIDNNLDSEPRCAAAKAAREKHGLTFPSLLGIADAADEDSCLKYSSILILCSAPHRGCTNRA